MKRKHNNAVVTIVCTTHKKAGNIRNRFRATFPARHCSGLIGKGWGLFRGYRRRNNVLLGDCFIHKSITL
jgi:hypothetical protein